MPRKLRQLRADLKKVGWYKARQVGSHEQWKHPLLPEALIPLAGKDGDDADHYQECDVRAGVRAAQEAEKGRQP